MFTTFKRRLFLILGGVLLFTAKLSEAVATEATASRSPVTEAIALATSPASLPVGPTPVAATSTAAASEPVRTLASASGFRLDTVTTPIAASATSVWRGWEG